MTRNDKRTVNNYKQILQGFIQGPSKKQASQYEIQKAIHKSGSIMDDIFKRLLAKGFLICIGERPPKRGGISKVAVYELTPIGHVLLGYLSDDDKPRARIDIIKEGVKSFNDNPFYTLTLSALEDAPQEIILNSVYIWLESFNLSDEFLLQIILTESNKTQNQDLTAPIREKLLQKYELLDEIDKGIVFEYFRAMTMLKYIQKLRRGDLYLYLYDAKFSKLIVHKCEKCGKIIKTNNPFETKKLCDECANSAIQNPN